MMQSAGTRKQARSPRRSVEELQKALNPIATFIRQRRKMLGYTQEELAERTGTSLGFIKALELGKNSVRVDKVNQVLSLFGARLEPQKAPHEDES